MDIKKVRLGKTDLWVTKTAMGCLPIQRISRADAAKLLPYREFLTKRAEAKAQVDKDWEEYQAEHNQHYEDSNPR